MSDLQSYQSRKASVRQNEYSAPQTDRVEDNPERIKDFDKAIIAMTLHKHKQGEDHLISDKEASMLSKFARAQTGGMHVRTAIFNQKKEIKVEKLREEKARDEVKDCTFTPELMTRKRGQQSQQRNLQNFWSDQLRFLEIKKMKQLAVKQEVLHQEMSKCKPTPRIATKSAQMTSRMSNRSESAMDRLYAIGVKKQRERNIKDFKSLSPSNRMRLHSDREDGTDDIASESKPYTELKSQLSQAGKPDRNAYLYGMHQQRLNKREIAKEQLDLAAKHQTSTMQRRLTGKQRESMSLRLVGFKKEFQASIADLRFREELYAGGADGNQNPRPRAINVRSEMLDFNMVAILLHRMGFLQAQRSDVQEEQVSDMYRVLKLSKTQNVPAMNLMNFLVVIMGLRDPNVETIDTPIGVFTGTSLHEDLSVQATDRVQWFQSGHFDPDGSLKFREREVNELYKHFEPLRLNRRVQRRDFASLHKFPAHVRSVSELNFHPQTNEYSTQLAEKHRMKKGMGGSTKDLFSYLTTAAGKGDRAKTAERLRKEVEEREMQEVTGKPATSGYTAPTDRSKLSGFDRQETFKRLATRGHNRMKSDDRTKEDLEYERQKDECTFRPRIRAASPLVSARPNSIPSSYSVQLLDRQVTSTEKYKQRIQRGYEERARKAAVTLRGVYPGEGSAKKAHRTRKGTISLDDEVVGASKNKLVRTGTTVLAVNETKAKSKYKSIGGVDGAQIKPPKSSVPESQATSASRGWNPLHFPKKKQDADESPQKPANQQRPVMRMRKPTYADRPLHRDERVKRKRLSQMVQKRVADDEEILPELEMGDGMELGQIHEQDTFGVQQHDPTMNSSLRQSAGNTRLMSDYQVAGASRVSINTKTHQIESPDQEERFNRTGNGKHSPRLDAFNTNNSEAKTMKTGHTVMTQQNLHSPRIAQDGPNDLGSMQTSPSKSPMPSGRTKETMKDYEVVEQIEEEPKLVVTVKIDVNRTEQIFIYEDDKAGDLATLFCQEHGLPMETRAKLIPMLENQIATVLSRIPEDDALEEEQEDDDVNY